MARLRPGTLRIRRPLSSRLDLLADSEAVDPERRITLVAAARQSDPLVDHRQARAADGVVVEGARSMSVPSTSRYGNAQAVSTMIASWSKRICVDSRRRPHPNMPVIGAENGIAPRAIGVLLALRAAASIAARLGIGATVRRVGRTRLITIGAAMAAAALVGMTATHEVWKLAVLSIVAGFAMGFGQPLSMTLIVQLVPAHARSTALAVRLTGNRIGQVATPAAAAVVAGRAGAASVFWLLGVMLAASAVAIQRGAPDAAAVEDVGEAFE